MPRNPLAAAIAALERAQATHLRAAKAALNAREARNVAIQRAIKRGATYRQVAAIVQMSAAGVYGLCRKNADEHEETA